MEKRETIPTNSPKLERVNLYIHENRLVTLMQETIKGFDYEDLVEHANSMQDKGAIVVPAKFNQEIYQLADRDRCCIIRINYE